MPPNLRTSYVSPFCHLPSSGSQTFPLSAFHFCLALDRVHEGTLDVVEKNNADKQNRQSEAAAVEEVSGVESATTRVRIAKRLDDWRHWICQDEPAEAAAANH